MVLVSSSTVSFALSSSIFIIFTLLLFLSGLVLQQQSVRSIQAVIRPPEPPKINHWPPQARGVAKRELQQSSTNEYIELESHTETLTAAVQQHTVLSRLGHNDNNDDKYTNETPMPAGQAIVQFLFRPSAADICSSILLFGTLASNSSVPSQRVLFYPESWDSNPPMRSITSALKVLRSSSAEYNVVLHPTITRGTRGQLPSEKQLLKEASGKLAQYERILYLRAPGLLLNAETLDTLLIADLHGGEEEKRRSNLSERIGVQSQYWIPGRLTAAKGKLPPAFLVTSRFLPSGVTSVDTHVLNPAIEDTYVDSVVSASEKEQHPAYMYFQRDVTSVRERESIYYQQWINGLGSVCHGIDLTY
ncbi:hypothetical protein VTO42DRAFT_4014 [Malbranchea cinnamomea]